MMSRKRHNERCRDCKENVFKLLATLFNRVESNWDLNLPCRLEDYINTSQYEILRDIYNALKEYRGFIHFVKSLKLSRVDYFIPDEKLIVEFDESQHFTKPRDIALSFYPYNEEYGFSVQKWRMLCQRLDKRDNDPPYRDEQRAWYDTLRDFAPILSDSGRTIRLYSRDLIWCSLDPTNELDLLTFKDIIINRRTY